MNFFFGVKENHAADPEIYISNKIDFKAVWPRNSHADSVGLKFKSEPSTGHLLKSQWISIFSSVTFSRSINGGPGAVLKNFEVDKTPSE